MTYLVAADLNDAPAGDRIRALLARFVRARREPSAIHGLKGQLGIDLQLPLQDCRRNGRGAAQRQFVPSRLSIQCDRLERVRFAMVCAENSFTQASSVEQKFRSG